jgi:hypothetical protein
MASVTSAHPSSLHLPHESSRPVKPSSGGPGAESLRKTVLRYPPPSSRTVHTTSAPRVPASVFVLPRRPPPGSTSVPGRGREPLPSATTIAFSESGPSVLVAPDVSIPSLREEINRIESKMANLMSERNLLESRLAQAVRLQSPIHRIPGELLAHIFTIAVLDMEDEDPLMLSTLMLVSKQFRDIAVKTSVLWSRIVVSNHYSLDSARRKLSRSMSTPIHVSIEFNPQLEQEHGSSTTETVVHAMDILRPSIYRWKSLR